MRGSLTEEGRVSLIGWKGSIGAGIRGSLPVLAGSKGSLGIARMKKPTFAHKKAVKMDELKKEEPSVVGREKSLSSIGAFELLLQDPKLSSINLVMMMRVDLTI